MSILHALSADDHILTAFRESVTETMRAIEADSRTRVRVDGNQEDRRTGELAWAHFTHQTARPVTGFLPDPHLHSHCFVFNATWDAAEERFKAGQFRDIKRDMPYYQAVFHKTLGDRMTTLGYQIRTTDKSFEIEGVPQKAIDLFSKRTDEIGRVAREKGITDAKELDELGARTRASKQKGASMTELKEEWRSQIVALGLDGATDKPVRFAPAKDAPELTAQHCIDYALSHCFERASVMEGRRILETATRRAVGVPGVSAEEIAKCFEEDKRITHVKEKDRTLCTTKEVLTEEQHMVELARAGQGRMLPLYEQVPEIALREQQRRAIEHLLTTRDRVSIIRGVAGAGKTTLMKEAVEKIEQAGKTVTAVAPSAQASHGVLKEEGFAEATTVAHFLTDKDMQEALKDQVLWVDEAGLLGTQDMTQLLELTERQNARLILAGDTCQHASVVRGDALRILNTVAGIQTAEVSKIYRQTTEQYREAVKDLSDGNVARAFEKLDDMGCIKDVHERPLVKDYVTAVKQGTSALVISPTHAQGEDITDEIRAELRQQGLLGKKEIEAVRLRNLNLTQAEKSDPRQFTPGQIVHFNQNAHGFRRGSQWTVVETTVTGVQVRNSDGVTGLLPAGKSNHYDVFEKETILLSKGDRIRITRNGFDADKERLNNGDMLTVASVSKGGRIVLRNDISKATYAIDRNFGHLAHAHCITSHAAQGKTVDEVFIFQPAATFPATDAKQFYVSVSRARSQAHIYTDDREELLEHAAHLRERQSALELLGKDKDSAKERHMDGIARQQRAEQDREQAKERNRQTWREDYEPEL